MMNGALLVDAARLQAFVALAFARVGIADADAQIGAEVLVASDLRGVDSHGVARLHYYLARIRDGLVNPAARPRVVRELPAALTLDAENGLGMAAAHQAMQIAIERAAQYGSAAVAVRRSNHFGIAGYYAMMALPHDMIGLAMCNASALVVPFGGTQAMLGTNPIAWAVPCGQEPAVVVDMATSGIAYGKLEVARRTGAALPLGWALDEHGQPTSDAGAAMRGRRILPLGGLAEGTGYKGYALSTVVEALSHALAGAAMSRDIKAVQGRGTHESNIGHFFAAYRVDAFRELDEFRRDMDELVRALRSSPPLEGVERVLLPGEKERRTADERARSGIPLHPEVIATLRSVAEELQIEPLTYMES